MCVCEGLTGTKTDLTHGPQVGECCSNRSLQGGKDLVEVGMEVMVMKVVRY